MHVADDVWTAEELIELARRQKHGLWTSVTVLAFANSVTAVLAWPVIGYVTFRLAQTCRSRFRRASMIQAFVPVVNWLTMLQLVSAATKTLKAHGVRVGLMGANSDDLDALRVRGARIYGSQPVVVPAAPANSGSTAQRVGGVLTVVVVLMAGARGVLSILPSVTERTAQLDSGQYYSLTITPARAGTYDFAVSPQGGAALIGCAPQRAFPARIVYRTSDIDGVRDSTKIAAGQSGSFSGSAAEGESVVCMAGNPSRASISVRMKMTVQ